MRQATVDRKTNETNVSVALILEGHGRADIQTGVGFMDHMLQLFCYHGNFDLAIRCAGDTQVDDHHSVEDIGIALGMAFSQALGDKAGIARYGNFLLPMDEALVLCAVDLSGRDALGYQVQIPTEKVGAFDTELVKEFMLAFARNLKAAIHFHQLAGENSHHIIEAMFKGLGRCMGQAVGMDAARVGQVPSSKGTL